MAFNTQNPVGSTDPRDLYDNAEVFDKYVTGTDEVVTDRLGQPRFTPQAFHNLVLNANAAVAPTINAATAAVNAARDTGIQSINQSAAAVDTAEGAAKASMLKTAAELGNDLNNKHYSTYAKMVADPQTRDAVVAVVDADPDASKNGWYRWDNAVKNWKPWADQPVSKSSFQAVAELIEKSSTPQRTHVFEDQNGFAVAALTDRGALELEGGLDMSTAEVGQGAPGFSLEDINGFTIFKADPEESYLNGMYLKTALGAGFEFVDEKGFVLGKLGTDTSASSASEKLINLQEGAQVRSQIMHVIGYGQSLGRGVNALPAISTTQPYKNVMIASGVRSREGEAGYYPEDFAPLVEQTGSFEGETPISALCNGVVRRAVSDGESPDDWVFLGSSAGQGGRAVEQLMPTAEYLGYFNKLTRLVNDMRDLSAKKGKSYSVWAYSWDQGESNYEGASYTRSPYLYMQYMLNLFDTLTRYIASVTGQAFRPYIFSYQVGAHRKYNRDNMTVALAQWRASVSRPDFVLAVPVYIFKTGGDYLHLTNEASWLLGEYKSRAMYMTMVRRGQKWRPLEPVSVAWSETHLDISFHVPCGPLVLDFALCDQAENYGFDVWEDGQPATIIDSVSVLNEDTVRVALTRAAAANAVLCYARGRSTDTGSGPEKGARGNLRDSNGDFDKSISPLGNTFELHNPCVMFQYDRITGF